MKKPDGGPAFPQTWEADSGDQPTGMSLRDYFAGQAMQALTQSSNTWVAPLHVRIWFYLSGKGRVNYHVAKYQGICLVCYEIADAMLAEREK